MDRDLWLQTEFDCFYRKSIFLEMVENWFSKRQGHNKKHPQFSRKLVLTCPSHSSDYQSDLLSKQNEIHTSKYLIFFPPKCLPDAWKSEKVCMWRPCFLVIPSNFSKETVTSSAAVACSKRTVPLISEIFPVTPLSLNNLASSGSFSCSKFYDIAY